MVKGRRCLLFSKRSATSSYILYIQSAQSPEPNSLSLRSIQPVFGRQSTATVCHENVLFRRNVCYKKDSIACAAGFLLYSGNDDKKTSPLHLGKLQKRNHSTCQSSHAVDHCTCIRVHAAPPRGEKKRKEKKVKTPIVAISIAVDGSAPLRRVNAKRKYAPPYLSSTHASTDLCGVPPQRGSTVLALSLLALRGSTPRFLFTLAVHVSSSGSH